MASKRFPSMVAGDERGFSLIELMAAVIITTVIVGLPPAGRRARAVDLRPSADENPFAAQTPSKREPLAGRRECGAGRNHARDT